jgi:hypothetical protein
MRGWNLQRGVRTSPLTVGRRGERTVGRPNAALPRRSIIAPRPMVEPNAFAQRLPKSPSAATRPASPAAPNLPALTAAPAPPHAHAGPTNLPRAAPHRTAEPLHHGPAVGPPPHGPSEALWPLPLPRPLGAPAVDFTFGGPKSSFLRRTGSAACPGLGPGWVPCGWGEMRGGPAWALRVDQGQAVAGSTKQWPGEPGEDTLRFQTH